MQQLLASFWHTPVLNPTFRVSADSQPVADDHPADLLFGFQPCHRGFGARQCSTVNNVAVDSCEDKFEIYHGGCYARMSSRGSHLISAVDARTTTGKNGCLLYLAVQVMQASLARPAESEVTAGQPAGGSHVTGATAVIVQECAVVLQKDAAMLHLAVGC